MTLKICFNPETQEVIRGEERHGSLIKKNFDRWVRAIYFEKEKRLYFRFYDPKGRYQYLTQDDYQESLIACDEALKEFQRLKLIGKNVKVLYWSTDKKISEVNIKY